MRSEVLADAEAVARKAAAVIATQARHSVAVRGLFVMAVSGGHTPWVMLRALAGEDVPWASVHIFQVDSVSLPMATRTETSRICGRLCSSMPRCPRGRSTPCHLRFPISKPRPRSMPLNSGDRRLTARA
jgi:hypothetical protein